MTISISLAPASTDRRISSTRVSSGARPAGKAVDYNIYDITRTDQANIFPMTEGYITYQYEYTQASYTPTYPGLLSIYQNFLNGIVDIGFSHTSQ